MSAVSEAIVGRTTKQRRLRLTGAASSPPASAALTWRDPPPKRHRILTPELVAQLRANPGRWAVVREYPNRTAVAHPVPKHPFDLELRRVEEPPGSVLYARARPKRMLSDTDVGRGEGQDR